MSYEYQDNKKSTDTSDIAPGAPIWFRASSGVHNNRDAGHGYSAQIRYHYPKVDIQEVVLSPDSVK